MARDDVSPRDIQLASSFSREGNGTHPSSNNDETASNDLDDYDEHGGSNNPVSDPSRLPPISPSQHGDTYSTSQPDVPADETSLTSYQQPGSGQEVYVVTDNSPKLHINPDFMDDRIQDPMHNSLMIDNNTQNLAHNPKGDGVEMVTDNSPSLSGPIDFDAIFPDHLYSRLKTDNNMQNLAHNPNGDGVEMVIDNSPLQAHPDDLDALLPYPRDHSILIDSMQNIAHILNDDALVMATDNSPLLSDRDDLDALFPDPTDNSLMTANNMQNVASNPGDPDSPLGLSPSDLEFLAVIFPECMHDSSVTSNDMQNVAANSSEHGVQMELDYPLDLHPSNLDNSAPVFQDSMQNSLMTADNMQHVATNLHGSQNPQFGRVYELAGSSLPQSRAPERPHAEGQNSVPDRNRNLEQNTQAGQIRMDSSIMSQGSQLVSPATNFSSSAELPSAIQTSGSENLRLSSNRVPPSSSRLNPNAQPFISTMRGLSALNISESSPSLPVSTGSDTQGNQSSNLGQPQSTPTHLSRDYSGPAYIFGQPAFHESGQAFPVHHRSSITSGTSDVSSTPSLLDTVSANPLYLYPSVPNVSLTIRAPRSPAQTISSRPSQMLTPQSSPPVSISTYLPPMSPSSSVRSLRPRASHHHPYMYCNAPPSQLVSTSASIRSSRPPAASLRIPETHRDSSNSARLPPRTRSTQVVYEISLDLNEPLQLIGEQCYLCKRDLAFEPDGPIQQPSNLPFAAVLPCGHTFHDSCLKSIFPEDLADPPCIPCALEET